MDLHRLKWAFLGALALLLLVLEWTRSQLDPYLVSWQGKLLFAGVVAMCVIFPVGAAFTMMSRMQERLSLRNRELLALDKAARDIYGELSLETILQKVIDQSRVLLDARSDLVDPRRELLAPAYDHITGLEPALLGAPIGEHLRQLHTRDEPK